MTKETSPKKKQLSSEVEEDLINEVQMASFVGKSF